jgi:xylan 1,4-beta-xylosidase
MTRTPVQMPLSRRRLVQSLAAGAALPAAATLASRARAEPWTGPAGEDGQRKADLGDGTFLNPIVAGDRPDPTILKDGEVYYMTFTPFDTYPALVIWRSTDMVNWEPMGPALRQNIGNIFAVDLVKHDGRYFIYMPVIGGGHGWRTFVIWADDMAGPWSEPIDTGVNGFIDPSHIVGEDGKRYLFVSGIKYVRLTDDGLSADGELKDAYDPWRYPDDWVTENFAPEGPKLIRRGEWFYLVTAVGGTAGPPTGHMVIAARSRSVHGPWEHCPHNPLVRTRSAEEPWWSRGHATLVEGPAGDWWMVYHGYEAGFWTLGRQTLLDPIEWTDDGWFRALGGDLGKPLAKPRGGRPGPSAPPLTDGFSSDRMGVQWVFHQPGPDEARRAEYLPGGGLMLAATGQSPADSAPLTCIVPDRSYEAEISLDLVGNAQAGLLMFYNRKAFTGIGFDGEFLRSYQYAGEQTWTRFPLAARSLRMKVTNHENIVTWFFSIDEGATWRRHDTRMEVSGLNHNVFGDFLSLRIGLFATGEGAVRLRDFRYRGNPPPVIESTLS